MKSFHFSFNWDVHSLGTEMNTHSLPMVLLVYGSQNFRGTDQYFNNHQNLFTAYISSHYHKNPVMFSFIMYLILSFCVVRTIPDFMVMEDMDILSAM